MTRHHSVYGAPHGEPGFQVVVTAGSHTQFGKLEPDAVDAPLDVDRADAISAIATAVVERGGSLIVPANPDLAHLVALAAAPHARPHGAEQIQQRARVHVVETIVASEVARELLRPLIERNLLTYQTVDGEVLPPTLGGEPGGAPEADEIYLASVQHQPLTQGIVSTALGVVVLYPDEGMLAEMRLMGELNLGSALGLVGARSFAQSTDTLWLLDHDALEGRSDREHLGDATAPPHGVLMELLVERWLSGTNEFLHSGGA